MAKEQRPGLPALNESRAVRRRQVATGKTAIGGIPPRLFLFGLLIIAVGGFLYFRSAQSELEEQRSRIMAKQRAVTQALGPKLVPMRDLVEKGMRGLLEDPFEKQVAEDVNFSKLFAEPGIYFRLRAEDAQDVETARKAAQRSLRDGFTSCLIRDDKAPLPTEGKKCKQSQDCEPGELCNEFKVCQRPSSPFNMRLLYRALHVLSDQWTAEVRDAGTELALVAYERGLDSVTEVDIPVAIDVYQRAEYAVVVLDEDPEGGLPKQVGEGFESEAERVQRSEHEARVGVWSIPEGELLAKVKVSAAGELRDVGAQASRGGPEARAALERQANNCALAMDVRNQLMQPESARGPQEQEPSDAAQDPSDRDQDPSDTAP